MGPASGARSQRLLHHPPVIDIPLTMNVDVKVYGFMTVPADAKCGVCAHEIGHLGTHQSVGTDMITDHF